MKNEEQKPKREPISVRMDTEIIVLARSLARSIYGSEDKLGYFLETAVQFYSSHSEDEARATALLKTTEDILFRRVNDQIENVSKDLQKKLVERLTTLQAISSYETTLTELMLRDIYIKDSKSKVKYEELRSTAATRMKDRMFKAGQEQLAELQSENIALQKKVSELENKIKQNNKSANQQKETLKMLGTKIENYEEENTKLNKTINSYRNMVSWYKRRDIEAPNLQKSKKSFMKTPSYEEVNNEYENINPRPDILESHL